MTVTDELTVTSEKVDTLLLSTRSVLEYDVLISSHQRSLASRASNLQLCEESIFTFTLIFSQELYFHYTNNNNKFILGTIDPIE